MNITQLMNLQQFFLILEEEGEDAAIEFAESIVGPIDFEEELDIEVEFEDEEKPHLTLVG